MLLQIKQHHKIPPLNIPRQIIFLLPLLVILPLIMGIDGIMYAGPVAEQTA